MNGADGSIYFKDWLPDQPDLNNAGLTEAQNILPVDGVYRSFPTLGNTGFNTANARVQGAIVKLFEPSSFTVFEGTSSKLYVAGVDKSAGTYNTAATGYWRFDVLGNKVIATNGADLPQIREISTTGSFATINSAPAARQVGAIGQFAVLGNLQANTNVLQWSSINDPTDFPTPASATAIARQAGSQTLSALAGDINSILGGDQFGIVLQAQAITRMTYVGGSVVFQFDDIESAARGAVFPNGAIRIGKLYYFVSADGFFVTDGVEVKPIGKDKVDRYFAANCDITYRERVYTAHDARNRCIYWSFPTTAATSGRPNKIIVFNYEEGRWGRGDIDTESMTTFGTLMTSFSSGVIAFTSDFGWRYFTGAPGSAILITGELEPNVGGFARINGIKPLVDQAAVTLAMGTRNDRTSAVSYTGETSINSRSGFADFRTEARYHRARMTIAGTFNAAQGLEYQAVLTSAT